VSSFFDEIAHNNTKSLVLLFIFSLFFIGIIYLATLLFGGGPFVFAIGVIAVVLYALFTYYAGDKLVLAVSRAEEADPKQYATLYSLVEGLSSATQIRAPKVYIIKDPNPNAFATGRRSQPSLAVTTGLLATMNRSELEGVLGHEISHIADNDILVMTIAIAFGAIIGLVAAFVRNSLFYGARFRSGDRREDNSGMIMLIAVAIGLLAPLFALLIRLAISRKREYLADANGARMTRNPAGLASALKKIQTYSAKPNAQGIIHANEVTAPLYFSNPFTTSSIMSLFSTHPPIEDRIKKLEKMY